MTDGEVTETCQNRKAKRSSAADLESPPAVGFSLKGNGSEEVSLALSIEMEGEEEEHTHTHTHTHTHGSFSLDFWFVKNSAFERRPKHDRECCHFVPSSLYQ